MRNVIRLALFAGTGLYEKLREEVDELVKLGELKRQEGQMLLETIDEDERSRTKELQEKIERAVRQAVERLPPVAIRRDIAAIEDQLQAMSTRLDVLEAAVLPKTSVPGTQ